jgi:hypothetical protein
MVLIRICIFIETDAVSLSETNADPLNISSLELFRFSYCNLFLSAHIKRLFFQDENLPLVSPSRKQPDDDIEKQPPSIHTAQLSPIHNAVSMEDDSKQPSSHVVEKDHSKEQLRYLNLGSMAQLTPGSMAQLTPGSMAQLKEDSLEKSQQQLSTMPTLPQGTACMNSIPSGILCCVVEKGARIFFLSVVSLTLNGRE